MIASYTFVVPLVTSITGAFIALVAYVSSRSFQTHESLSRLLEHYQSTGLHTLMWRMEQATRPEGKGNTSWSLEPVSTREFRERYSHRDNVRRKLFDQALASDWTISAAHMHDVHFFALRVRAWVTSDRLAHESRRVRLLNNAFGHQLLSTLLDHHIVALRLRRDGELDSYYPTQYGLFETAYQELLGNLADDMLKDGRLPEPIRKVLENKHEAVRDALSRLVPTDSALVRAAEADSNDVVRA